MNLDTSLDEMAERGRRLLGAGNNYRQEVEQDPYFDLDPVLGRYRGRTSSGDANGDQALYLRLLHESNVDHVLKDYSVNSVFHLEEQLRYHQRQQQQQGLNYLSSSQHHDASRRISPSVEDVGRGDSPPLLVTAHGSTSHAGVGSRRPWPLRSPVQEHDRDDTTEEFHRRSDPFSQAVVLPAPARVVVAARGGPKERRGVTSAETTGPLNSRNPPQSSGNVLEGYVKRNDNQQQQKRPSKADGRSYTGSNRQGDGDQMVRQEEDVRFGTLSRISAYEPRESHQHPILGARDLSGVSSQRSSSLDSSSPLVSRVLHVDDPNKSRPVDASADGPSKAAVIQDTAVVGAPAESSSHKEQQHVAHPTSTTTEEQNVPPPTTGSSAPLHAPQLLPNTLASAPQPSAAPPSPKTEISTQTDAPLVTRDAAEQTAAQTVAALPTVALPTAIKPVPTSKPPLDKAKYSANVAPAIISERSSSSSDDGGDGGTVPLALARPASGRAQLGSAGTLPKAVNRGLTVSPSAPAPMYWSEVATKGGGEDFIFFVQPSGVSGGQGRDDIVFLASDMPPPLAATTSRAEHVPSPSGASTGQRSRGGGARQSRPSPLVPVADNPTTAAPSSTRSGATTSRFVSSSHAAPPPTPNVIPPSEFKKLLVSEWLPPPPQAPRVSIQSSNPARSRSPSAVVIVPRAPAPTVEFPAPPSAAVAAPPQDNTPAAEAVVPARRQEKVGGRCFRCF